MKITKSYSEYNEYYDEKLYSTGNDELDDLLERAFCDGYEYAQREFAERDEKEEESEDTKFSKKLAKNGKRIAAGGGILAGTGAGLMIAGGKRGIKGIDKISELENEIIGHEFHMKDHFGHANDSGFFGKEFRKSKETHERLKSKAEQEIKDILKKDGKHIKATKAGMAAIRMAAPIALGGGIVYAMGKGRERAKKYRRDIRRDN